MELQPTSLLISACAVRDREIMGGKQPASFHTYCSCRRSLNVSQLHLSCISLIKGNITPLTFQSAEDGQLQTQQIRDTGGRRAFSNAQQRVGSDSWQNVGVAHVCSCFHLWHVGGAASCGQDLLPAATNRHSLLATKPLWLVNC